MAEISPDTAPDLARKLLDEMHPACRRCGGSGGGPEHGCRACGGTGASEQGKTYLIVTALLEKIDALEAANTRLDERCREEYREKSKLWDKFADLEDKRDAAVAILREALRNATGSNYGQPYRTAVITDALAALDTDDGGQT